MSDVNEISISTPLILKLGSEEFISQVFMTDEDFKNFTGYIKTIFDGLSNDAMLWVDLKEKIIAISSRRTTLSMTLVS